MRAVRPGATARVTEAVKVLVVAPAPLSDDWAGGISNFVRSFVQHMPADFRVSIAGVATDPDDESQGGWRPLSLAGREVRFLPVTRISSAGGGHRVPVKAKAMVGLLRARRHLPARVVVQVHAPAMDLPLAMRTAPVIRVVHNAPDNLAAPASGTLWRRAGWVLRRLEAHEFRSADRVFFVDRATYERYAATNGSPEKHMTYLHNGIDTAEFAPQDVPRRAAARHALGTAFDVPQTGPWLLFCGRLDRQKDPALLVATFARARRLPGLADAHLVMVGDGPLMAETRRAAHSAGVADAVHFAGNVDHDRLPQVMAAANVLLLTSDYEGTPFVVLEALACGLPVVSTSVGDVPALVHHQQTGFLAASHSPDELARGVAWAVAQPRDEIAPRAASSMIPYRIETVLAPFYDAHRTLAQGG